MESVRYGPENDRRYRRITMRYGKAVHFSARTNLVAAAIVLK
jgi:hypothetical protein